MKLSFVRLLSAVRMGCGTVLGRALILAFLLPLALGPALSPLATALGAPAHLCACGMKEGTCGCPECERQLGMTPDGPLGQSAHAVLRSCDDHGRGTLSGGASPCVLPASITLASSPLRAVSTPSFRDERIGRWADAPPTPPPRA